MHPHLYGSFLKKTTEFYIAFVNLLHIEQIFSFLKQLTPHFAPLWGSNRARKIVAFVKYVKKITLFCENNHKAVYFIKILFSFSR